MKSTNSPIRSWLVANGYSPVAEAIDEIINAWKKIGKKTRRNWWDVLAGGKNGRPIAVEGRSFPILRAARIRKGWKVTANCICHNKREKIPQVVRQARWQKNRLEGGGSI